MKTKQKFKVGQVVCVIERCGIARPFRVESFDGTFYRLEGDTLNFSWREAELRPLTKREKG